MSISYIALGSNLDDPKKQIVLALGALERLDKSRLLKSSVFYQTEPIDAADQPNYINAVACLETTLTPLLLLSELQAIENKCGRQRHYFHAPRTLDLDLLLYDHQEVDTPSLKVPHPRMHLRAFVIIPLLEINKACQIPGRGLASAWLPACAMQKIHRL